MSEFQSNTACDQAVESAPANFQWALESACQGLSQNNDRLAQQLTPKPWMFEGALQKVGLSEAAKPGLPASVKSFDQRAANEISTLATQASEKAGLAGHEAWTKALKAIQTLADTGVNSLANTSARPSDRASSGIDPSIGWAVNAIKTRNDLLASL